MRFVRLSLLIACSALSTTSLPAQSVHDLRGEAIKLYDAGRFQEALPLFDELLKSKPRDIESHNKRGCILIRMNQPARAIDDFNAATRYNPFLAYDQIGLDRLTALYPVPSYSPDARFLALGQLYPSAFTNRGVALMMLGRDDDAMADFRQSIAIRNAYPDSRLAPSYAAKWRVGIAAAYCGVGQVLHRKGDEAQALAAYEMAIRYSPGDPNGIVGRGVSLAGLGKIDEAIASFNDAIRLDPSHSRAFGYRAITFERLGRDNDALADYDASIRLDPTSSTVRRMRGAMLSRLGRNEQAIADFDEAIRLNPNDSSVYKDRGGVLNRLGDPSSALRDLDLAVTLDPKSSRALQNRAAAYNDLHRYDDAVRDCDKALTLDPKNAGALNNRGLALSALGEYSRAIADLTDSIRLQPEQVAAYHNRAGAYVPLGQLGAAAADYEEVVRRAPHFTPGATGLAQVRERQRLESLVGRDDLAARQDSSAGRIYRDLGSERRAQGDWAGAIAEFNRALELNPKDADALSLRGWSRACAGDIQAEADARSWLDLKGWRDPFAPYMALLGIITARQADHPREATAFLDEALANTRPPAWPALMFRYLKRTLPSTQLLAAADTHDKLTEARTVIGLDLIERGERSAGIEHLRWVRDRGLDRSIAKDLARETLKRLEANTTPPATGP